MKSTPERPSWEATVAAAMNGDRKAIEALWQEHRRWLAAVLLVHKSGSDQLEDLLQDVAMTLVSKISTLREVGNVRAWLRTIAVNVARASARRGRSRPRFECLTDEGQSESCDSGDGINLLDEEAKRVLALAQQLPEAYRFDHGPERSHRRNPDRAWAANAPRADRKSSFGRNRLSRCRIDFWRRTTERKRMNNEHQELLVSRVIEPDASSAQWDELEAAAEADPELWQRTVNTLRDQQAITRAVNRSVAIADVVSSKQDRQGPRNVEVQRSPLERPHHLLRWSGWAVAALVALAWVSGLSNFGSNGAMTAGLSPSTLTAAEHFQNYLSQGRREGVVFDEVPEKILVQTRQLPTGGQIEIIFIRQILERTTLPDLYQYQGEDESGRPTLVKFQANAKPSM